MFLIPFCENFRRLNASNITWQFQQNENADHLLLSIRWWFTSGHHQRGWVVSFQQPRAGKRRGGNHPQQKPRVVWCQPGAKFATTPVTKLVYELTVIAARINAESVHTAGIIVALNFTDVGQDNAMGDYGTAGWPDKKATARSRISMPT